MKILGFDTAAKTASVALTEGGRLVSEFYLDSGFTHSETVLPMAKALLEIAGTKPEEIDVFAVNCGPGSFTGLRIGIAAVKAMAMSLKKPCAAVSTLEALAENLIESKGVICPVMDARRNEVYNALFEFDGDRLVRLTPDRAISLEDLAKEAKNCKKSLLLIGDGASLCYNYFSENNISSVLSAENVRLQSAYGVAMAARGGNFEDPALLEPNYLRLSQAERERLAKAANQK